MRCGHGMRRQHTTSLNPISSVKHRIGRPHVPTTKTMWLCTAIISTEICSYLLRGGGRGLSKNWALWNRKRLCTRDGQTPQLWNARRIEAYQSKRFLEQLRWKCPTPIQMMMLRGRPTPGQVVPFKVCTNLIGVEPDRTWTRACGQGYWHGSYHWVCDGFMFKKNFLQVGWTLPHHTIDQLYNAQYFAIPCAHNAHICTT